MILKNNIFMTILEVSNLSFGQGNIEDKQTLFKNVIGWSFKKWFDELL